MPSIPPASVASLSPTAYATGSTSTPRLTLQQARVSRVPIQLRADLVGDLTLFILPKWLDEQCKGLPTNQEEMIALAFDVMQPDDGTQDGKSGIAEPNYDHQDRTGDFEFETPAGDADHVIYQVDQHGYICHIVVKGEQPPGNEDALALAEIGQPTPLRETSSSRLADTFGQSPSEESSGSARPPGGTKRPAGSPADRSEDERLPGSRNSTFEKLSQRLADPSRKNTSISGQPATSDNSAADLPSDPQPAMPQASYDTLKPCEAAGETLTILSKDNANITAAALFQALKPDMDSLTLRPVTSHLKHFDSYLAKNGGIVATLANFAAFAKAEMLFFGQVSAQDDQYARKCVHALRTACFPETPSQAAALAAIPETEWPTAAGTKKKYLTSFANFDVYLANKDSHLDTLLTDPTTAERKFILEKHAFCNVGSHERKLKPAMLLWRRSMFPRDTLEKYMADKIDSWTVMEKSTRDKLKRFSLTVAEYPPAHGLNDMEFIKDLQDAKLDSKARIREALCEWTGDRVNTKLLIDNL